ncbi:MAG: hypothetical protein IT198_07045 [Acidimicrobiia bacterium]|nr:hypothetical protein [Acidimicrobiia bacterium]
MTAAPLSVETAAALAKLGRVLEVDEDEIEFLGHLDVDRLRLLHWQILDSFQAANSARLQRVAGAAKLLPAGLVATLAERRFGSVLCAQLVGLVEPARAGQYARHMTPGFMADITARTDPRVAGALARRLDLPVMQAIAVTLVERDDYLTLAGFVDHLPAEIIASILEAIDDNATVVRIARYVEDPTVLDPVVALIPDDRILGLVTAVDDEDLWADGLHLFSQLGNTQITRIADALLRGDPGTIRAAFDGFERHDVWHHGVPVTQAIAVTLVERGDYLTLAGFVDQLAAGIVAAILEAIDDSAAVVRIARYVEDPTVLDPIVALIPDDRILGLVAAVDDEDLWVDGLHLFSQLGDTQITRIAGTLVAGDPEMIRAAFDGFERHDAWHHGIQLLGYLDADEIISVADVLLVLDDDIVARAVDVIDRQDAWDLLVKIALAASTLDEPVRARLRASVAALPEGQIAAFEAAAAHAGHPDLLERILARG